MPRKLRATICFALSGMLLLAVPAMVCAQSATTTYSPSQPVVQGSSSSGSATVAGSTARVGLEGYCPVCLAEMKKWVRGSSQFTAQYDGRTYWFPEAKQRDMFLADPVKYVPVLNGDCVPCYVNGKQRVPGNLSYGIRHKGRFYFMAGESQKKEFLANIAKYENADLAMEGNCAVCLVEMGKEMPGKPEFAALHNGLRFLFPSAAQKKMFEASPAKYAAGPAVALDGYCAVCVMEMKKWMKGKPEFSAVYDGRTYLFPGEKQKEIFLANPVKYVPALGGDCTVCLAKMGKRMPGSVFHGQFYKERLYLFPGQAQLDVFRADPEQYANVDLALGGNCSVCLVEMKKEMPGKREFSIVHRGMVYLFPSNEQRQMFLANPQKYEVKPTVGAQAPAEDAQSRRPASAAEQFVNVQGKSGCAGCDHGVHPIGATNTLGLAVNATDGQVYVVEDAHRLYPDIYEDRGDAFELRLKGKVLKVSGNFVWVTPSQLERVASGG